MNPIESAFRAGYKLAAGIKTETIEQSIEIDRLTMVHMIDNPAIPNTQDLDDIDAIDEGDPLSPIASDAIGRICEAWR